MAFNRDITDAEIQANGMTACPDKMTGTAAQNKARFDKLVSDVVKAKFNGLIDDLEATSAAGNIGFSAEGLEATKVKDAIEELVSLATALIIDTETTTATEILAAINAGRELYLIKTESLFYDHIHRMHYAGHTIKENLLTHDNYGYEFMFCCIDNPGKNAEGVIWSASGEEFPTGVPTWTFYNFES